MTIYSDEMTVGDLLSICKEGGCKVVTSAKREEILRGQWKGTRELIEEVCFTFDLVPRFIEDTIVLVKSEDGLTYVRWASGRPQEETQSIIAGLSLARSFVVDAAGLAFIGVPASEVETLQEVLKGLDSGDDWLVQVSIVDGSGIASADAVLTEISGGGGWTVRGNDLVETFLMTLQAGAAREQTFGSQVPFRTNVVTENGLFLDGNVEYQEIKSVVSVEVVEASTSPKIRITVESRRPGSQSEGLFEIIEEEIESEFFVREKPVLVGSLRRWDSSVGVDARWPVSLFERAVRRRNYQVYCHAVRLPRPPIEEVVRVAHKEDEAL